MTVRAPGWRRLPPIALFGGDIPSLLWSDPAKGGDGAVRLNPMKAQVSWAWFPALQTGSASLSFSVAAAPAQTKAIVTIKPSQGSNVGDFEATTLLCRAESAAGAFARVALQPYVKTPTVNRMLSNQPISHSLMSSLAPFAAPFIQALYATPNSSWEFQVQNLAAAATTVTIALHGRQYANCDPCNTADLSRRADHLKWFHPYWIGPQDPSQPTLSGPEITLAAGSTRDITFPIPSDADFLMYGMLDDSTRTGGGVPALFAQVTENWTKRGLVDLQGTTPSNTSSTGLGINWKNFLAIPTVSVTGFPLDTINASGLAPNLGGLTHLVPRNSQVVIRFTSLDAADITLRPALMGLLVYGKQSPTRVFSIDGTARRERVADGLEFLRSMGLTSPFAGGGAR